MKYKALKSFIGAVSMRKGEVKEITSDKLARELILKGFIAEAEKAETSPAVEEKADESAPKKTTKRKTKKKAEGSDNG